MNGEWELENIEEAHRQNPDRFLIPNISNA